MTCWHLKRLDRPASRDGTGAPNRLRGERRREASSLTRVVPSFIRARGAMPLERARDRSGPFRSYSVIAVNTDSGASMHAPRCTKPLVRIPVTIQCSTRCRAGSCDMSVMMERIQRVLSTRYVIERELGHGGMAVVF